MKFEQELQAESEKNGVNAMLAKVACCMEMQDVDGVNPVMIWL